MLRAPGSAQAVGHRPALTPFIVSLPAQEEMAFLSSGPHLLRDAHRNIVWMAGATVLCLTPKSSLSGDGWVLPSSRYAGWVYMSAPAVPNLPLKSLSLTLPSEFFLICGVSLFPHKLRYPCLLPHFHGAPLPTPTLMPISRPSDMPELHL